MRALLAVLIALIASSCGALVQTCTLIGCMHTLTLNVVDADGVPTSAFHGSAVDAQGTTIAFACPQTDGSGRYQCEGARLQLFDMSTEQTQRATIEVSIGAEGAEAVTRTIEPAYTGDEINGPGCGFCFSSTATVALD